MNFYERYCGDYGRDTGDLSLVEHGAYTLMLDHYYSTERPLPAELGKLYRICRAMRAEEREAVRSVAERFFPVSEDGLRHNQRADEEIAEAQPRIAAARENGRKGGRPRKTHEEPSGFQLGNPVETHTGDTTPHTPLTSNTPTAPAVGAPDGALPDCPHEQIVALYHSILPENPKVIEWNDARRGYLRSRWREKAKPNGKSHGYATLDAGLAYWRRFFEYVGASTFLTGKGDGRPGRPPFVATLEWLVRPQNFAKVVEGNYHR